MANIEAAGYELKPTGLIINCTIVPYGSSVELASRERVGWYKDKHVAYFSFEATQTGIVSQSQLDVPHAVVRALLAPDANSYLQDGPGVSESRGSAMRPRAPS